MEGRLKYQDLDAHLAKARKLVGPYVGEFGDLGAYEQLILDVGHALAEAANGDGDWITAS